MRWKPNTTVATLVYDQERFLLIEEWVQGKLKLNQPAGHLEADESLFAGAKRETLEESGWQVRLTQYLGLYVNQAQIQDQQIIYHRHCFIAVPEQHFPERELDTGIVAAHWLTWDEIQTAERAGRLRSPMVLACCRDFLAGRHYPLEIIQDFRGLA